VRELSVPVVIKETGCGFSKSTLKTLNTTGVFAVDVGGLGGTHWGRVEGQRHGDESLKRLAADTFANWGESTVDSLRAAHEINPKFEVWASGGVRSGLDVAKCIALGAKMVGVAQPLLKAALRGEEELHKQMETLEFELRVAMFC